MTFKKTLLLSCIGITLLTTDIFASDVASSSSQPTQPSYAHIISDLPSDANNLQECSDRYSPVKIIKNLQRRLCALTAQGKTKIDNPTLKDMLAQWIFAQRLHYIMGKTLISINENFVNNVIGKLAEALNLKHPSRFINFLKTTIQSETPDFTDIIRQTKALKWQNELTELATNADKILGYILQLDGLGILNQKFPFMNWSTEFYRIGLCLGLSESFKGISHPLTFAFLPIPDKERILDELANAGSLEAISEHANYYGKQINNPLSLQKSADSYKKAIELGIIDHYYNLAVVYSYFDQPQSILYYKKALDQRLLPRTRFSALSNLAAAYWSSGALTDAEKCYRQAFEIKLDDPKFDTRSTKCGLALVLIEKNTPKSIQEAERIYEELCAQEYDEACYNYAKYLEKQESEESLAKAERLYRLAVSKGFLFAKNNLALLIERKKTPEALTETEQLYREAIALGDTSALNNLGVLLYKKNTPESRQEAESLYRRAVEGGIITALLNLGITIEEKNTPEALEEAESLFRRALEYNVPYSIIKLARLLSLKNTAQELEEAESLFKEAIRLNLPYATVYYADFLKNQNRFDEAENLFNVYEITTYDDTAQQDEGSDSADDDASSAEEIHEDKDTTKVPPSTEPKEEVQQPGMSKKQTKMFARLEKEKERAEQETLTQRSNNNTVQAKTYRDIAVSALPDAVSEIQDNELIVQKLISMLAGGETKRANFEQLQSGYYSMRINKRDRLVFQITDGNLSTGVKGIKILAARGHYTRLDHRLQQTTAPQSIEWSNDQR